MNNTICLDTGCVFGGRLTALRYPEREIVATDAAAVYYEPIRPLGTADDSHSARVGTLAESDAEHSARAGTLAESQAAGVRDPEVLELTDVTGSRVLHTGYLDRIGVRAENAAAALEVMSRFAIDPRWLVYLPPTMSPVATATEPGLLEHPAQAFEAYRSDGVAAVICEEKHMGSRAVALVCRDPAAARARFGAPDDAVGAVWTRTGRPFFGAGLTGRLLGRLRDALKRAGVFDELGSGWVLLDAELLPWSVKAGDLLRSQYAAVGAAATAALPVDSANGGSATSARWRCASTRSGWRRWTGSLAGSRSGGCTSACSPSSPWSRSRWTRVF